MKRFDLFDPKWIVLLGFLVGIETALSQGTVSLTNMIPEHMIPAVKAWSAALAWVGNGMMTALAAWSSKTAGPMVKAAAIILALIVFGPDMVTPANAQLFTNGPIHQAVAKKKAAAAATASTTAAATTPAAPAKNLLEKLMDDLAAVKAEVIAGVIADLEAADVDAATIDPTTGKVRDLLAHTCYPAQVLFLQSLPMASAPSGKYIAVQLHQKLRDFVIQVKAGIPDTLKLACAPMIGDDAQIVIQTLGLVGVQVGASVLTGGLSLPALPAL